MRSTVARAERAIVSLTCIYCGCTDDHACILPLREFDSPAIRAAHDRFLESAGVLGIVGGAMIACWWISRDPPVCSAPACTRRFTAARLFDQITADAREEDSSRDAVGQGTL